MEGIRFWLGVAVLAIGLFVLLVMYAAAFAAQEREIAELKKRAAALERARGNEKGIEVSDGIS